MAACLSLIGCGGTEVRGDVLVAARLPVRTYPSVIVASGLLPHEQQLAQALVEHLVASRPRPANDVELVDIDRLEPMRRAGHIAPGTVVLILGLEFREALRPEWGSRPETVCGPFGCYTTRRNVAYDIPTSRASLRVTLYDGPSARELDQVVLHQEDEGREYAYMRDRLVESLGTRVQRLVDTRRERVEVELCDSDLAEVERAATVIAEEGDWTRARGLLEEATERRRLARLSREDRACVLYDLALAQRFDPASLGDPAAHFAAAERTLQRAIRLDPDEDDYQRALVALRHHRREVMRVREQQSARERNFEIAEFSASVPEAPAAYRDADR